MKEKFITFPQDHQLLSKEELGGKVVSIITPGIIVLILVGVS